MSNNYTQSSTLIPLPPEKLDEAREFVTEYRTKWDEEAEEGESFRVEVSVTPDGIWVRDDDEYIDLSEALAFIDAAVERFQLTEPVVGSWACTSDKPGIDEFGGGAFFGFSGPRADCLGCYGGCAESVQKFSSAAEV